MTQATTESETLVLERRLSVPVERVYRAWTDPAELVRWYTAEHGWTITIHEHDLRVGGHFRVSFTPPDAPAVTEHDVYEEIVRNERLTFTMTLTREDEHISTTRVTVTFAPDGGGTRLTITDVGPLALTHDGGWVPALEELETYLAA